MLSKVENIESGMNRWVAVLRVVGVGFYIGGSIILGVLAGSWLDGMLNTKPVLVIVGLILGIVVAFYGVYIMVRPFIGNKQNKGNS
jgi:ATP synthase protein I